MDDDDSADDADQYHKSPTQMDDDAMIEDTQSGSSPPSSSSGASYMQQQQQQQASPSGEGKSTREVLESSATPSKLAPGPESPLVAGQEQHGNAAGGMLSPPSAVMGVQAHSPSQKPTTLPGDAQ